LMLLPWQKHQQKYLLWKLWVDTLGGLLLLVD